MAGIGFSRIIVQGLEEEDNQIDQNTDSEKTAGEQIHDSQEDPSLIKLVDAKVSQEKAQEKCHPFVFHFNFHPLAFKNIIMVFAAPSFGIGADIRS